MAYYGEKPPTDRQIDYLSTLARKIDMGNGWDFLAWLNGWARSGAQRKASKQDASEAIDLAQALAAAAPGELVGGWYLRTEDGVTKLSEETRAIVRADPTRVRERWEAITANWRARKAAGEEKPLRRALEEVLHYA